MWCACAESYARIYYADASDDCWYGCQWSMIHLELIVPFCFSANERCSFGSVRCVRGKNDRSKQNLRRIFLTNAGNPGQIFQSDGIFRWSSISVDDVSGRVRAVRFDREEPPFRLFRGICDGSIDKQLRGTRDQPKVLLRFNTLVEHQPTQQAAVHYIAHNGAKVWLVLFHFRDFFKLM